MMIGSNAFGLFGSHRIQRENIIHKSYRYLDGCKFVFRLPGQQYWTTVTVRPAAAGEINDTRIVL